MPAYDPNAPVPVMIDQKEVREQFFKSRKYDSARDIIDYLADQYYIYGPERSGFGTWTSSLRAAVGRDALHFEEYYENPEARKWYDGRGRTVWHNTNRCLDNIFKDIAELTAYVVEEREWMDEFLFVIYKSWNLAKKRNFKHKLNGQDEYNW